MDPAKVLEITYDLFLISEILANDISKDVKEKIEKEEYEIIAKFFIYRLAIEVNELPIYKDIRKEIIRSCLFTAMTIDMYGFKDSLTVEQFANLMYKFFKYSLENKLNIRLDKEKWKLAKNKLNELAIILER